MSAKKALFPNAPPSPAPMHIEPRPVLAPTPAPTEAAKEQATTEAPKKQAASGRASGGKKRKASPTATPRKRKQRAEDLPPGVLSPERMSNGLHCKGCDHGKLEDLTPYGKNYFTPKEFERENYPKECSGCHKSLLPGKDPEKHCKISGIFEVRCCRNSINHSDHQCVFALCHTCWVADARNSSPNAGKAKEASRKRRKKVLGSPYTSR